MLTRTATLPRRSHGQPAFLQANSSTQVFLKSSSKLKSDKQNTCCKLSSSTALLAIDREVEFAIEIKVGHGFEKFVNFSAVWVSRLPCTSRVHFRRAPAFLQIVRLRIHSVALAAGRAATIVSCTSAAECSGRPSARGSSLERAEDEEETHPRRDECAAHTMARHGVVVSPPLTFAVEVPQARESACDLLDSDIRHAVRVVDVENLERATATREGEERRIAELERKEEEEEHEPTKGQSACTFLPRCNRRSSSLGGD